MAVQHPQDFARPFAVTSSRMESGLERHARRVWPIAAALLVASATASAQQTPSEHQLQEVVVSASGFEQAIKDAPASITVITREELQSNRVNSIAEALAHVEGVDVTSSIGKTGGLNIQMRGLGSQYTLILIEVGREFRIPTVTV
ncbi:MAG: TonB-dependent receptor plug domain-containing protein [Pseudomonadota bacterium]